MTTVSRPSGTRTSIALQVVQSRGAHVDRRRVRGHRATRVERMAQRLREEAAGDRLGDLHQRLGVALRDHAPAAAAGARAEVDDMVRAADRLLVVLDDEQRVALRFELLERIEEDQRCRADAGRSSARRGCSRRPADWSRAAPRAGCAAPRRRRASARSGRARGRRGRPRRGRRVARRARRRCRARSRPRGRRARARGRSLRPCSPGRAASRRSSGRGSGR